MSFVLNLWFGALFVTLDMRLLLLGCLFRPFLLIFVLFQFLSMKAGKTFSKKSYKNSKPCVQPTRVDYKLGVLLTKKKKKKKKSRVHRKDIEQL